MTPVEQAHIVSAITFELGKCFETTIRGRWPDESWASSSETPRNSPN